MRKALLILALIFGMTGLARAQQKWTLSAAAASCTTSNTSCLIYQVDPSSGGATFTVGANASGNTLQFEATGDGGTTWVALNATPSNSTTAATSTTSTGTWQANVAAYTGVRIRMSTLVSGTATVSIITSIASARSGGGGASTSSISSSTTKVIYAADPQYAGGVKGDSSYSCVAGMTNGSKTVTTDPGTSTITNTALTSNVATITSAQNFQVGDTISITGSTNGGGVFNVSNVVITTIVAGTSFSFALVNANVGSAADTGTVQGPSIDVPFTSADVGDIIFGTNMPCAGEYGFDFSTNTNILPIGTITAVNNAHSVQASNAATATCTGTVNTGVSCQVGWARHDDYAALQAAFNAALVNCGTLVLPVGNIFFSAPVVNKTSRCGVQVAIEASASIQGFTVTGEGMAGQTTLIPSPSLDASTAIPAGGGAKILFGSPYQQAVTFKNFNINGLGNDEITNGNGKCILTLGWNSTLQDVAMFNWGNQDNQTNTALCSSAAIGGPNYISNFQDANGGERCAQLAKYTTFNQSQCLTFAGVQMFGGEVYTSNSYFANGQTGNFGAVQVFSNGVWKSSNDFIQIPSFSSWCVDNQGVIFWTNMHCSGGGNSGNGGGIWLDGTGATVGIAHVTNSSIGSTSGGSVLSANGSASGTYFDGCNNSFTASSGAVVATNVNFFGSCSVTGTTLTAAKLVLSANWGTSAAVSVPLGATAPISFTITNGSAATGASPTITYTFPTPYYTAPLWCTATQVGGTNATGTFTSSSLTATGMVLTYSLTPTANDTELIEVACATQG